MADQIFRNFTGSISQSSSTIVRFRPDLSVLHEGS